MKLAIFAAILAFGHGQAPPTEARKPAPAPPAELPPILGATAACKPHVRALCLDKCHRECPADYKAEAACFAACCHD